MRLAANNLAAATNVTVYTVPANTRASFTLSLCFRVSGGGNSVIRIALQDGALADGDYIEYDLSLAPFATYERSGIILGPGQSLMVRSSLANVSAVVYGVEEQV